MLRLKASLFALLLFVNNQISADPAALSGPANRYEDALAQMVYDYMANHFGEDRIGGLRHQLVYIVRHPWEPLDVYDGRTWQENWRSRCQNSASNFADTLAIVGCTNGYRHTDWIALVSISPMDMLLLNEQMQDHQKMGLCYYDSRVTAALILHESLHRLGYRHSPDMTAVEQQIMDAIMADPMARHQINIVNMRRGWIAFGCRFYD